MNRADDAMVGRLSGLASLTSAGAALVGFGAGQLLANPLAHPAMPALLAGLALHVYGMVGAARLRRAAGDLPSLWQMAGYWLCWLTLALLVAYTAWGVVR